MALQIADDRTAAALLAAGALLVASAGVLAGCMQQRAPAPPGQAAQIQPGMGFFLDRNEDEGWKLAYGQGGTDNVWLMLECKPGSRKLDVFDIRHDGARKGEMLTLTSGKIQSAVSASVEPDEASGDGKVVIVHTSPDLPALDGFRHSGSLAVKLGAREYALSASPAEKPQIARFFNGCERR
jgi:hypothetical protein